MRDLFWQEFESFEERPNLFKPEHRFLPNKSLKWDMQNNEEV